MTKSRVFIFSCASFALGIFVASKFSFDSRYIYALVGVSGITIAWAMHQTSKATLITGWLAVFFCLGFLRFSQALEVSEYQNYYNQQIKWEAYLMEDPDVRADKQLITLKPNNFEQRILITTTKAQDYFYGDWVLIEGKLKEPKAFDDFDYAGYLERFGIFALMAYPKVVILKNDQGHPLKTALLKIKHKFMNSLSSFLSEPQNSLALGITIGARRGLPAELTENFNITGTSHIVAMSGFNIAVIVGALSFLPWIAGRRVSFWLSALIILGFVIVAGASASIIRAACMGILLVMAFNIGRLYAVMPALVFAGAAMLYINPKILYWDVGFQLSFAATLGLVLFMPLLEKLTVRLPKVLGLKILILATLSATISTLPLVVWYFGRLSLVSLLANILVLPVVPMAMLFSFLTVVPIIAPGFAFLANLLLVYILWVVEKLASWPYSSVPLEISAWVFCLMAALLAACYYGLKKLAGSTSKVEKIMKL